MKISKPHFLLGAFIGCGLLVGIVSYVPDGKLHVVFCDVGQGDAIYMRLPNSADILVDGGPNDRVLECLGTYMPFYDRTLEMVILTHPQKDHLFGLVSVLDRYSVKYFVTVPVGHSTELYEQFLARLSQEKTDLKYPTTGDSIRLDAVTITTVWPYQPWLLEQKGQAASVSVKNPEPFSAIAGFKTDLDLNIYSLYLHVQYKDFDLLLTGDGDIQTQKLITQYGLTSRVPKQIEVLKVPHHGSRTALERSFLELLSPQLSVVEVGKNSYGHPDSELLKLLSNKGSQLLTTAENGHIEVITNGFGWKVRSSKSK